MQASRSDIKGHLSNSRVYSARFRSTSTSCGTVSWAAAASGASALPERMSCSRTPNCVPCWPCALPGSCAMAQRELCNLTVIKVDPVSAANLDRTECLLCLFAGFSPSSQRMPLMKGRTSKHRWTLVMLSCRRLSTTRPSCQHSVHRPQRLDCPPLPPPPPLLPPPLAAPSPSPLALAFECCCTSSADSCARSAACGRVSACESVSFGQLF